ncbi:hypothetical protein HPB49_003891 [Dermacentor silvarum]|uniref:Uncharacterized protein n=1 Tax=Dermacentor silvarum TaxID=543639 RepID=A0ACB8C0J6_DERSI|nr:hypothetical protein HPB49_003891 [Dermacentor silvarum]
MQQQSCTNKDTGNVSRSVPTKDDSSVRRATFLVVESTERDPVNRSNPEMTTELEHSTAVTRTKNLHPESAGAGTVTEVRVADTVKTVPDGLTVKRQEPPSDGETTGGALLALLPVTSSTRLDDVDIAASPPTAKDEAEPVPPGTPVSERQVAGPQLREIGTQSTCVTPPGTPLVPSPDTKGDWSAALHALYTPVSMDESYQKTSVGGLCFLLIVLPAVAITIIYIVAYVKGRSQPALAKFEVSPLSELTEAEEHVRTFNYRVMSSLLGIARDVGAARKAPHSLSDQMALFYSSCFAMAVTYGHAGGSAGDVVTALGTSVETWLGSPTLGSFLELVVSASLKTGLPSIIAVWFKYTRLSFAQQA